MYHGKSSMLTASAFLALFGGAALVGSPPLVSAENGESQHVHSAGMNAQSPGWAERLKGQTIVEDSMEGRAERAALVEQQHNRLMEQMQKDMEVTGQNSGAFNSMSMIHQYGAGQGTGLLSSAPGVEP
ncbi:MAG: hypothetical protein KC643_10575, partial [Nitrospira sp.]|nr:hypothetical protein [Nitrospira sp.]